MSSVSDDRIVDETCPLLHDRNVEAQTPSPPAPTPIPTGQLAALCSVRIVEPIAFTQLFPYVNEFMSDLHLTDDPSRIGFYSGLVVRCIPFSVFDTFPSHSSGECICTLSARLHLSLGSYLWSVYSRPVPLLRALTFLLDVIGRRPVILVGIFTTAIATLSFGLSKSLAVVLIARCIGQALRNLFSLPSC